MKRLYLLVIGSLLILLGWLATDWANKQPYGFYRNALWADKSGYYIYLPFAFEYQFNASAIPDSLSEKTGSGFAVEDEKLITKYPIGVAWMELPFYAVARISNLINDFQDNPYQGEYVRIMVLAPVLYVSIGLFLLFLSLRLLDIRPVVALVVAVFTLFGTSLFYYTVIEGLMSHSFSFSLFAAFTFIWLSLLKGKSSRGYYVLLGLVVALILAVRPFNAILLLVYAFSLVQISKISIATVVNLAIKTLPWLVLFVLIAFLPQLLYYKYAYGGYLVDSYSGETFDFGHPQIVNMLVSAPAGLFIYVPAMLFFFVAAIFRGVKMPRQYSFLALALVVMIYVLASWHSWSYGCGFGIRPFVEWLPLLVIPLATWVNGFKGKYAFGISLLLLLIFYNIRMSFVWSGCWFGKEDTFAEFINMFWT